MTLYYFYVLILFSLFIDVFHCIICSFILFFSNYLFPYLFMFNLLFDEEKEHTNVRKEHFFSHK